MAANRSKLAMLLFFMAIFLGKAYGDVQTAAEQGSSASNEVVQFTLTEIQNTNLSICNKDPELQMLVQVCGFGTPTRPNKIECRDVGLTERLVVKADAAAQSMNVVLQVSKKELGTHFAELRKNYLSVSVLTSLFSPGVWCDFFTNKDANLRNGSTKTTYIDAKTFELMLNPVGANYVITFHGDYGWGGYNENDLANVSPFKVVGTVNVKTVSN